MVAAVVPATPEDAAETCVVIHQLRDCGFAGLRACGRACVYGEATAPQSDGRHTVICMGVDVDQLPRGHCL